ISTASDTVVATIRVGREPYPPVISPDGRTAYVSNRGDGSVSVFSTRTNQVLDTVEVGHEPYRAVMSPDGATAYVSNAGSDSLTELRS
ncbi:MAG: beta-propeller fold lactonase family protein, partial [Frankiaceae bacterium]|nr:beta-propeller fold lactonase family protein [Frankiaceae bacterium]